jgi:hypothetical protein
MARFSDDFNKTIAKGYNLYGQARAIGELLGVGKPKRGGSMSDVVASEIRKNGIARPTYAYTEIGGRGVIEVSKALGIKSTQPLLTYRNDGFSIPGLSLATSEHRPHGVGPTVKRPYGVTYQDVTFNYILDASSNQHTFFYKWMDSIVRHTPAYGGGTNSAQLQPYQVGFLDEYSATLDVWYFDETFDQGGGTGGNRKARAQIIDAYPIFIGDIQYNWGGTDQLIRLPVTYTYTRWELPEVKVSNDLSTSTDRPTNLFSQLLKAGSAIQALSTLRSPRNVSDVLNVVNVGRNVF